MNAAISETLVAKRHEAIVRRIAALKAGRFDEVEKEWRKVERLDKKLGKVRV